MGGSVRVVVVMMVLAGCSMSASQPSSGSPPDADARLSCDQLQADFQAALAEAGGHCTTDADCTFVGGQVGPDWTCDCAPAIGPCGGSPIERNSPGLARALADVAAFTRDCPTSNAICDCAPSSDLHCNAAGYCTAQTMNSCLSPP